MVLFWSLTLKSGPPSCRPLIGDQLALRLRHWNTFPFVLCIDRIKCRHQTCNINYQLVIIFHYNWPCMDHASMQYLLGSKSNHANHSATKKKLWRITDIEEIFPLVIVVMFAVSAWERRTETFHESSEAWKIDKWIRYKQTNKWKWQNKDGNIRSCTLEENMHINIITWTKMCLISGGIMLAHWWWQTPSLATGTASVWRVQLLSKLTYTAPVKVENSRQCLTFMDGNGHTPHT